MNTVTKVLIPEKEWLIKNDDKKIGSVCKNDTGYEFIHKGIKVNFDSLSEIKAAFGISLEESKGYFINEQHEDDTHYIYGFPCRSIPYEHVYSVKKRLPLYTKSSKSKSQYCAGFYVVQFRKGWLKAFCPKLITLDRYPYHGPFKSEAEMKTLYSTLNKP